MLDGSWDVTVAVDGGILRERCVRKGVNESFYYFFFKLIFIF